MALLLRVARMAGLLYSRIMTQASFEICSIPRTFHKFPKALARTVGKKRWLILRAAAKINDFDRK